jgi:hypothetical protein
MKTADMAVNSTLLPLDSSKDTFCLITSRNAELARERLEHGLDGRGTVVRLLPEVNDLPLLRNVHTDSLAHVATYLLGTGVKRPGREAGYSPASKKCLELHRPSPVCPHVTVLSYANTEFPFEL